MSQNGLRTGWNGLIQSAKLIKTSEWMGYTNQASVSDELVKSSNQIGQTILAEQVD